jgi:uncharacterized membrane protein YgaE (UPF0421/DUF939 family)
MSLPRKNHGKKTMPCEHHQWKQLYSLFSTQLPTDIIKLIIDFSSDLKMMQALYKDKSPPLSPKVYIELISKTIETTPLAAQQNTDWELTIDYFEHLWHLSKQVTELFQLPYLPPRFFPIMKELIKNIVNNSSTNAGLFDTNDHWLHMNEWINSLYSLDKNDWIILFNATPKKREKIWASGCLAEFLRQNRTRSETVEYSIISSPRPR